MAASWTEKLHHSTGSDKPKPSRQEVDDVRTGWRPRQLAGVGWGPRLVTQGVRAMAKRTDEQTAQGNTDAESGNVSRAAVALTEGTNASRAAVQELTKAYQE